MAQRKAKLSKYEVTLRREIEQVAVVEVEARNVEEAIETAINFADNQLPSPWREGDVIGESSKAKLVRE